jgi:hypothetical protein
MATIRKLKKKIELQIFEVISDCFTWSEIHADKKKSEVSEILADAVTLRNDLIHRVNHTVDTTDPKVVRAHFQLIQKDLLNGTDELFKRLSSVSKTKTK